ncbi:cysteine-rich venom protein pseudecin [Megalops cyprinoides]|uniref:cysteine-rich venom protein pseudecin n=1 Tax=Megalops cyprinoides TaxID=118141 RepID=UPI00186448EA|nr:cysteine-rich venom protein pseudecin [Megalops cyprinoides]
MTGISTDNLTVQDEILNVHNAFRRNVEPTASNMLKMSWSTEATKSVQAWVNGCSMSHGPPSTRMIGTYECGENLFKSSTPLPWSEVIQAWHSEVKNYQYPNGSANGGTIFHYTQVVWYSSYEVGCAVASCNNSLYFYGCHYYRAGNFKGVPPYTAGPSCSACPDACEDKLCTNPCPYIDKFINCPSLKAEAGCDNSYVSAWCPALCQCNGKIIPVGKK